MITMFICSPFHLYLSSDERGQVLTKKRKGIEICRGQNEIYVFNWTYKTKLIVSMPFLKYTGYSDSDPQVSAFISIYSVTLNFQILLFCTLTSFLSLQSQSDFPSIYSHFQTFTNP